MDKVRTVKGITFKVNIHGISLENLVLAPAEVKKVTGLMGWAHRMSRLSVLPPEISDPPFKILFEETGNLKLQRENSNQEINFNFADSDELITALEESIHSHVDSTTLSGVKRVSNHVDYLAEQDLV